MKDSQGRLEQIVARHIRRRRDLLIEGITAGDTRRALSIAAIATVEHRRTAKHGPLALVLSPAPSSHRAVAAEIDSELDQRSIDPAGNSRSLVLGSDSGSRSEERRLMAQPIVIVGTPDRVIDHIRRDSVSLSHVRTVALELPGGTEVEQYSADLHFIYAKLRRRPATLAVTVNPSAPSRLLDELLVRPQSLAAADIRLANAPTEDLKEHAMKELPFDPNEIKAKVSEVVRAIHDDEDPIEITQYRKWVRKNTSVFNRGYILAYLLKYNFGGSAPSRPRRGSSEQTRTERPVAEGKKSIFVSIGRSKRVKSRDLISFFTSTDGVAEGDIGQVKVLDNYSFVEVAEEKAQTAIDALNGQEFRGRKLTVNYARKK